MMILKRGISTAIQSVRRLKSMLLTTYHRKFIQPKSWQKSPEYHSYLDLQLQRTILKKDSALPKRAIELIDEVTQHINLTEHESMLCIGARNKAEIDYWRNLGAKNVIGIDLFSEDESVLVMDMHQMTFPDQQFDLIYSSHCLEHAYDIQQVVGEILRVSLPGAAVIIEVPIRYQTKGADLIDLGSCENLISLFGDHVNEVIFCGEEISTYGSFSVARTIFKLK
ncbi:MAG TPA: hypothetical protein DEH22_17485 [Chloroflexi bacterium]|nr:hypothetical protein [Chloroflexota bacterium]